ncbi:CRISPR-associated endoribonuclease Cas6 [Chitinophaga silvatica]|uniref:CRISPR-associated endoribonuclease n=1 Tax=Chitinophaga silvatica TaxID=2282649 RepID=A0A3E1Y6H6_9BACT|nr:CRISPR-associated endoribonuclease Cas6 [Chitinophaga silvatica]RFS20498.1 CRISPR-associated endoribonuclease Cas6 [Chitinophaga silvatica]
MHIQLKLRAISKSNLLPINYQYPISAVIYKIINSADEEYAKFLHDTGYQKEQSLKSFKFFTFSDLICSFKIEGDRLRMTSPEAKLNLAFHLPPAAEKFISGLFLNQYITISDKRSGVDFVISEVILQKPLPLHEENNEVVLNLLSPIVSGRKEKYSHYEFLSPDNPEFTAMLIHNWKEKYETMYGLGSAASDMASVSMEIVPNKLPPRSRLLTIKQGTYEETKVRAWYNYRLKVTAPGKALELLVNTGCGIYNSTIGCGFVYM